MSADDKKLRDPNMPNLGERSRGDGLNLGRMLRVVFLFHRARGHGKGYETALEEAASWVRYSQTEVKRLLAASHRNGIGLVVLKGPTEEEIQRGEGYIEFGIGKIPQYPRIRPRRRNGKRVTAHKN